MIGSRIQHYKVTAKLGAGGMGEVYRATDTKLGRDVALKVLPEAFAADAQRMARFQREAHVLASLNHANIAAIYGLEGARVGAGIGSPATGPAEAGPYNAIALVMELVEGPTLAERIQQGAIPIEEALPVAKQIAEALEYAHEHGIIHRDLKPANIKLTPAGQVKVLDFGLAKALQDDMSAQDISNSPTLSMAATKAGIILGTAAYMSPEQAKGKAVDRRADIWAFGVVLFEMLTGRTVFAGETATDVIAALIRSEPEWTLLPATTPAHIRNLLRRCLEKDARKRLRDIGEARILLESPPEPELGAAFASPPAHGLGRGSWWLALAALILGAFLGVIAMSTKQGSPPAFVERAPHLQSIVELPSAAPLGLGSNVPLIGYDSPVIALSPDGSYLAYVAKSGAGTMLYAREMASGEIRPVPGTEGAIYAFFSPDNQWIGFLTGDKVKKVALQGGAAITLCEARIPTLAWWPRQGTIYFTQEEAQQVSRVPALGGAPELAAEASKAGVRFFTDVLPDGTSFLATRTTGIGGDYGDVMVVRPDTMPSKVLIPSGYGARYVPPGYLLFARAGNLMAVPFDLKDQQVRGEPVLVAAGVTTESFFAQVHATHSRNGLLAFVAGGDQSIGRLAWVDRHGRTEYLDVPPRIYGVVSLSPDGKQLAVHVADVKEYIWIYDFQRREGRRLPNAGNAGWPAWNPDGRRIAAATWENNRLQRTLFVRHLDKGGEADQRLDFNGIPNSWSSENDVLAAYTRTSPRRVAFLLHGKGEVAPSFEGFFAAFSPDGHWVAYASSQKTGTLETFIRSYPDGKVDRQVSTEGGSEPLWNRSGELFFRKGNRWYSTRVSKQPELSWDPPRVAFETDFMDTPGISSAVSPDGQRLLVVKRALPPSSPFRVNLIVNWPEELKRHAPAGKN